MRLSLFTLFVLASCCGCANVGVSKPPVQYDPALIDGAAVFGHTVEPAPEVDMLGVSPEMKAFIEEDVKRGSFAYGKFRKLMAKLAQDGYFINQYDRSATFSAAETFAARRGNCLAYTNLFVALAREAGLTARYQLVDVAPTWDVESGFLMRNNHINVRVDGVRMPGMSKGELSVDFNAVEADPDTRRRVVSDEHAASLFYANLGIDRLRAEDNEGAFAYLKRAILIEPANIDLWNNLGAVFSIVGHPQSAEQAYEIAMSLDERDKTAVSGLAKSLRVQGREEEAADYTRLAIRYQNKNAYYHFAVAEQAFRNDAFDEALASVHQAIRLKHNNPRFYALQAAAAQEVGNEPLVEKSLRMHRKHSRRARQSSSRPTRVKMVDSGLIQGHFWTQ